MYRFVKHRNFVLELAQKLYKMIWYRRASYYSMQPYGWMKHNLGGNKAATKEHVMCYDFSCATLTMAAMDRFYVCVGHIIRTPKGGLDDF